MRRPIIFIRHGATKLNSDDVSIDRIRGWKDIPLSPEGEDEAHKLAHSLRHNPPSVIVTSDLKRAADTAGIISTVLGVPVEWKTEKFRPWNVGDYTGVVSSKAIPTLADYAKNKPDQKIPGGENFDDFRKRFFSGLDEALDRFSGVVAIVSHHRDERLLKAWIAGGFKTDGSIDISTFNQKGEHTGSAERINIPEELLDRVNGEAPESSPVGKAINRMARHG